MLLEKVEDLLKTTLKEAIKRKHEYILLEHVLYEICQSKKGIVFFKTQDALLDLKNKLNDYLLNEIPADLGENQEPLTSIMVERVINRAIKFSIAANKTTLEISDILEAMLEEKDSFARNLLFQEIKKHQNNSAEPTNLALDNGLENFSLENFIGYAKENGAKRESEAEGYIENPFEENQRLNGEVNANPLPNVLIDLSEQAQSSAEADLFLGREKEIEKIYLVLARKKKNNAILVGEPGVGKTSIVQEMAHSSKLKSLPHFLRKSKIFALDYNALLVGTKFRGELEERFRVIFNFFEKHRDYILFLDDLHFLISGNSNNSQNLEVLNLIKSFLSSKKIKCIATITTNEYTNMQSKEMSLSRQFEPIPISETSLEKTQEILLHIKPKYEDYHGVHFPQETIKRIAELAKEYFPEKKLPDGAIDLLDYSGAKTMLYQDTLYQGRADNGLAGDKVQGRIVVKSQDVEANVSLMKEVKVKKINLEQKDYYLELEKKLAAKIFGQNEAINILLENLKLSQTGLLGKNNTLGSFLLAGPTGVGKTELTKILAEEMSLNLIRLDMSEFMEAHSVAKIIGAPPGYIGFNERKNELSEKLKSNPFSLILLDEIEKAHPDVINIFLQVMDYGRLTDSAGNSVNCRNALLIMTSNLGAKEMAANPLGFGELSSGENATGSKSQQAINNFFSPEFRNRLTAIISFNPLNEEISREIVLKLLAELNELLKDKSISIEFEASVIKRLISLGFDKKMGARPLKKIIEKEIKSKLIDGILNKKIIDHSKVVFHSVRGKILYKIKKNN